MAHYAQLDTNDQLTGRTKNISTPPPAKDDLAPGKPYWLPIREVITDNSTGEYKKTERLPMVVVGNEVISELVISDQTAQEQDDEANGIFNRLIQQDKASAAMLLVMRDLIMQAFGVTETQANNQLRTRFRDYYKSL